MIHDRFKKALGTRLHVLHILEDMNHDDFSYFLLELNAVITIA